METALPTRFREADERNRRIGRTLRRIARVDELDEDLLARLGRGLLECDRAGAEVARAVRAGEVTRRGLRQSLADGQGGPPALAALLDEVSVDPGWLDRDLLARGQRAYHRFGRNAADVLLQLSLIGGYRFGGPTELLVATGGLVGPAAGVRRRLGETQAWTASLARPGALAPRGEAWRLTLHVRVVHALVNAAQLDRGWDVSRWGLPVKDTDQAGTLGLFDGVALLGVRALGVPVSRGDAAAVMHLWRYVGWLMGVHPDFLVDDEQERHRINYHVLRAQSGQTEAGRRLAAAIVDVQRDLYAGPRGRYERERLLSMLTVFLGGSSMRDLGLPRRPPWAFAGAHARNLVRYRLLGRGEAGRARLERWGDRVVDDVLGRSLA